MVTEEPPCGVGEQSQARTKVDYTRVDFNTIVREERL